MKPPRKSKKSLQPTLRDRMIELALSEAIRESIKLIAAVGLAVIMLHIGAPAPTPGLILV